jgi:hypothetical protein
VSGFRFLVAAVLILAASACGEHANPAANILLQSSIAPTPARVGPASVQVDLTDPAGTPLAGAHVTMEADMSHAGMAPIFFDSQETGAGRYKGNLTFSMAGDWTILLHITLANGLKVEKQFEVPGVLAH